jgi:hypothetical protein
MKKFLPVTIVMLSLLIASCKKTNFDYPVTGEAINDFRLSTPADNNELMLNSATPATTIVFKWSAAKPGVQSAVTYTWKLDKKTGDFSAPLWQKQSDNNGTATQLSVSNYSIDSLLGANNIPANSRADLKWTVVANNADNKQDVNKPFNIGITRFGIGITSFTIFSPASSTSVLNTNPSSTTDFFNFRWQKAFAVPSSNTVTYKVIFVQKKYDANNNALAPDFSHPLFSIASNNNGIDTFANVSWKRMSDSLNAHGLSNLSIVSQLQWTVVATAAGFSAQANYFNELYMAREVKVYIVGSASPGGWDIAQSTRMIEDPRFPGTYYSYIYLTGGNEIKFVNGQAWPPSPGAVDWGQDPALPAGNIAADGENNIPVAVSGVYRVTFDLANNKFYLQTAVANGIGGMGMIGSFQGWSQPATKMNYLGVNKFIYITNMNTNDEFKFHDGNDWVNGSNSQNRWFAVDNTNGGRMVVDPGAGFDNFKWTGASGRMRAIWDGSNTTDLQYSLTPATQMRVVGNGMNMPGVNDWDPASSPQMTYAGNGVWTATLVLKPGEIKFLSGSDWGAFDYEDAGGGKIRWDGGPNFTTPAIAGTYTITLNESTGTYTIL